LTADFQGEHPSNLFVNALQALYLDGIEQTPNNPNNHIPSSSTPANHTHHNHNHNHINHPIHKSNHHNDASANKGGGGGNLNKYLQHVDLDIQRRRYKQQELAKQVYLKEGSYHPRINPSSQKLAEQVTDRSV